jgi:hypothetical protein
MGQYYRAIILGNKPETDIPNQEKIRLYMVSYAYRSGAKLMEHSYIGNEFVESFESLLTPEGQAHMSRVAWAGDYAEEQDDAINLYHLAGKTKAMDDVASTSPSPASAPDVKQYPYVVNHDKKVYVDKRKQRADRYGYIVHPLPLLTAEGNGLGGGDYDGPDIGMVGIWARDVISVEKVIPDGYTELEVRFETSFVL